MLSTRTLVNRTAADFIHRRGARIFAGAQMPQPAAPIPARPVPGTPAASRPTASPAAGTDLTGAPRISLSSALTTAGLLPALAEAPAAVPSAAGPDPQAEAVRDRAQIAIVRLTAQLEALAQQRGNLLERDLELGYRLMESTPDTETERLLRSKVDGIKGALAENDTLTGEYESRLDDARRMYRLALARACGTGQGRAQGPDAALAVVGTLQAEADMSRLRDRKGELTRERAVLEEHITGVARRLAAATGDEAEALALSLETAQSALRDNAAESDVIESTLETATHRYEGALRGTPGLIGDPAARIDLAGHTFTALSSPLETHLTQLTDRPDLRLAPSARTLQDVREPEEFAPRAQAWLTRQELKSGRQAADLLGPAALRALGDYGDPVLEPVGLAAAAPSRELVQQRLARTRALDGAAAGAAPDAPAPTADTAGPTAEATALLEAGEASGHHLVAGVSRLRPLAGPVWTVTTAPGSVGQPDLAPAAKEQRADGEEFVPWSATVAYDSAFTRFYAESERHAALADFHRIIAGLNFGAAGTVVGGELTKGTLSALFGLLTGGIERFTSSAMSRLWSLSLDLTSITLAGGGLKSRTAGAILDEIREAPFASLYKGVQELGNNVCAVAAKAQDKLVHLLENAPEIQQQVAAATGKLGQGWDRICALATKALGMMKGALSALSGKLTALWNSLPALQEKLSAAWTRLSELIAKSPHFERVGKWLKKAFAIFQENIVDLLRKLQNLPDLMQALSGLVNSIGKALLEAVPARALKEAIKLAGEWTAKWGGQFAMKLTGGKEGFDRTLTSFSQHLADLKSSTVDYAMSRSRHEEHRPVVGQRLETRRPVLAFRDQQAAFDYAVDRAATEPGDRHMVVTQVHLNDRSGRDVGPLLSYSPHHRGQDVLLLPGARLEITGTSVLDVGKGAGRIELLAAKETVGQGEIVGTDRRTTGLENLMWLTAAPAPSHGGAVRNALEIGTRAHAFHQIARFVMRYYGGRVEKWVAEVLGDIASRTWLAVRDRYDSEEPPQGLNILRGQAAAWAFRKVGLSDELAVLVENLASGAGLKESLAKVRAHMEEHGAGDATRTQAITKAIALAEKALDEYEYRKDKVQRKKKAERAALVIGAVMGVIETILKHGPQAMVDTMMAVKGPGGAALRGFFAHRFTDQGYDFVSRTDGYTAAAFGSAAAQGVRWTHRAARGVRQLYANPYVGGAMALAPYVGGALTLTPWLAPYAADLLGLSLSGAPVSSRLATTAGIAVAAAKGMQKLGNTQPMQRFAGLGDDAVKDLAGLAGGAGAGIGAGAVGVLEWLSAWNHPPATATTTN
ncbi:UmuC protein [Streptomyces sp. NBRC 110611]|uniref:hypothetical protein n=1 Tax=Streptomyces sp. NBRC 110611 TaxID=1621259 RepID=UPI000830DA74|nr:hypothetical protein [Streptomyces sp. NBRC 110611]GAU70301.1 UmuC protein [Streptomyces sp. NBRC 110611]